MKIYGRVISIRKTKNYVFLIINSKDKKQIQIVIEKEKYENIEKNDIISVDAIIDINNKLLLISINLFFRNVLHNWCYFYDY